MLHHSHTITELLRLLQVVGAEEDRASLSATQPGDQLVYMSAGHRIEPGGRLIKKD